MFGYNPLEYDLKIELANCCNGIATVYLAQYKPTNEFVTIKKYRIDKAKDDFLSPIKDEILTMRQFNHANIFSFYTSFINDYEIYLVAPLMCYGSCRDTMTNFFVAGFPEIIVALVLRDVLHGLEYLHNKGFIHRSIRASHILLNKSRAVISGFRNCTSLLSHGERIKTLHNLPTNSIKCLNWLAPEVLEQNLLGYTEKSDVYSIGITTCELVNGVEPFANMPTTFMFTEKIRGNQPTLLDYSTCPSEEILESGVGDNYAIQCQHQIYSKKKLSDPFHKFAELCLQRLPIARPNVQQLLSHAFFKQCKHTCLLEQFLFCGIETVDYNKFNDDNIQMTCSFDEMNLNGSFIWDF